MIDRISESPKDQSNSPVKGDPVKTNPIKGDLVKSNLAKGELEPVQLDFLAVLTANGNLVSPEFPALPADCR